MRLSRLVIETKKSTVDETPDVVNFESEPGAVDIDDTAIFLIQRIDSGGDAVTAKNLAISNTAIETEVVKADVLLSGDKSADHLNEANLEINALLIAEGK